MLERLLNVKEAAEILNVSEMTIRRWTDQGLLQCYRVGGRRARRFNPKDLLACLEGHTRSTISTMVPLGFNELNVPDGAHITHLSKAADESLHVALAFVAAGIVNHETVCIVTPDAEVDKIVGALQPYQLDVRELKKSGKLHLSSGMNSPRHQAGYLAEIADASEGRLRIFGDMTWTKENGWRPGDLLELEQMVNKNPIKNMLFLCQYKLGCFSGEEAMLALETHSHHIYQGALKENPYR